MATVNEKMTALADEIRELSGTTTIKSLDTMTSDVNAANMEIAEQTELLEQIATALEGKGAGGAVLPELSDPAVASDILSGKEAINSDGNVITGTIATNTSSNLRVSGATVTVPAGYYASQATKSVATVTQAMPIINIDASGKITATAEQSSGYVQAGSRSSTEYLTTQAAKTITPTTSGQTAVAKNVYTTGAITVAPIPSDYIIPNGTKSVNTNGIHDVTRYASVYVDVAGEDVTTETDAYTYKLSSLETAINELETELQGKASGGSGGSTEQVRENTTVTLTVGGKTPVTLHYVAYKSYDSSNNLTNHIISVPPNEPQIFQAAIGECFLVIVSASWDIAWDCGSGVEFYLANDGLTDSIFKVVSSNDATVYIYDED